MGTCVCYGSYDGKTWCEMPQAAASLYPWYRQVVDGEIVVEFHPDTLGGPSKPAESVMEIGPGGEFPARCLRCGGEKPGDEEDYMCRPCFDVACYPNAEFRDLSDAWNRGARDFPRVAPRPAVTLPSVPPDEHPSLYCTNASCSRHAPATIPASQPFPLNPRPLVWHKAPPTCLHGKVGLCGMCNAKAAEMQRDGVALSAIEGVPARKPPEPWVPSIDDWDLLPDAGR